MPNLTFEAGRIRQNSRSKYWYDFDVFDPIDSFNIPSFDGKVNSAIFRVANIEKREWFWVETRNMHRKMENAVSDTPYKLWCILHSANNERKIEFETYLHYRFPI